MPRVSNQGLRHALLATHPGPSKQALILSNLMSRALPLWSRALAMPRTVAYRIDTTVNELLSKKYRALYNHPAGPKTIHFWCPMMKWGLVFAGFADFFRPAELLSLKQNASLGITGLIWTRFCFVITPVNKFLGLCNFCLFLVGTVQVGRILQYEYGQDMQLRSRAMGERISHHGKFSSMSEFQLKEQIMDKINYVERDKLEQVLQILDEDDEDDMEDLYE